MQTDVETMTAPAPQQDSYPIAKLWPLYLGGLAATLTFGLGNICAPRIGATLGIPVSAVALVLGVFGAAFAAGMIIAGRLGDWLGRARLARIGFAALLVTSVGVAVSPGFVALLAARFAQGAAFAVLTPQILATIQVVVSQAERPRALATFAAASGAGTAVGQFLGGLVLAAVPGAMGWRLAFALTAVVAIVGLFGMRSVPETKSPAHEGLDVVASVIIAVALLALLAGISLGGSAGWPWWSLVLIAVALILFALLGWNQRRREQAGKPTLTPPSVVLLPPVLLGLLMDLAFFTGFGGFMYAFAVMTQRGEGMSALLSGALMVPFVGSFIAGSLLVPRMSKRLGHRLMPVGAIVQGLSLLAAAGVVLPLRDVHGLAWGLWMLPVWLVVGFAQAAQFGPLIATIMSGVPKEVAGLSGGLLATVQQAALGLGAALLGGFCVAQATHWGWTNAFAATLVLQTIAAVAFLICAEALRRHHRRA